MVAIDAFTNAVIFYNTMLRSQVYEQKMAAGDTDAAAAIRRMSPVAWQHVNLFSAFDFSDEAFVMDMEALVTTNADMTPVHYRLPSGYSGRA